MGIISTLLTGVTVVGKICQGITSVFGQNGFTAEDGVTKVYPADMTVGGATFYMSNEKTSDKSFRTYVRNETAYPLSVCLPDVEGRGGLEILVDAMGVQDLTVALDSSLAPDTQLLIGPVCSTDVLDTNATMKDTAIKLCLNSLVIGGNPVMIGGITITAAENKLTVQSIDSAIGTITYFSGISSKGISAEIQDVIYPDETDAAICIGMSRTYSLDFESLGYEKGDTLSCRIYFSCAGGNKERIKKLTAGNEMASPFVLECLQKQKDLKKKNRGK